MTSWDGKESWRSNDISFYHQALKCFVFRVWYRFGNNLNKLLLKSFDQFRTLDETRHRISSPFQLVVLTLLLRQILNANQSDWNRKLSRTLKWNFFLAVFLIMIRSLFMTSLFLTEDCEYLLSCRLSWKASSGKKRRHD